MVLFFVVLIPVAGVLFLAYLTKPDHIYIEFLDIPGFARINTSPGGRDEQKHTIKLPNGDDYLIPDQAKGHFVSLYDFRVRCKKRSESQEYVIPKGTPTDFASIPRVAHSLISPISNSVYGAVFHDYLYRNPVEKVANGISKQEADTMFYWGVRACGVNRVLAGLMYLAVQFFGSSSYKRM